jgi:hypothetical protein
MRTPVSRFSAFATVDPAFEERRTGTDIPATADTRSAVEKGYPAVVRAMTLLWGHPEMNQYFEKVWSGQDPSLNLDPDAMADLMMLAAVHQRICPYRPAKTVDETYGGGRWADAWKPARPRR